MRQTGAEALVATLEKAGVEYVFGLCGHANLSILDALYASRIEFVPVRHEQDAAHMADAYFRFSHKPGVVLTTIGPGLANAVTGVWEAALDSSAVVVIAGNVPSYMAGREAFQELSMHSDAAQGDVYKPFVKRAFSVRHAGSIPYVTHRAFNLATQGRPGPVLIDVPMDFLATDGEYEIPAMSQRAPTSTRVAGPAAEVERAVELLATAEAPLIHAGNGVTLSEASQALVRLAELLDVPVTTSMQAQGLIDAAHPLAGGYPGVVGTPTGNALARMADVVLAIGTRFSELETSSWDPQYSFRFGAGATLLQVDLDPHELGRVYPVEVGIAGDAGAVLEQMVAAAEGRRRAEPPRTTRELVRLREEWERERAEGLQQVTPVLRVEQVISVMADAVPEDTILLADAGTFRHGVGQYFPIRRPQSWFIPSGFGTMGGTASAALGAKIARPQAQVVDLIGDGGFSASAHSLSTAVEQGLDVKWVVLNNSSWDSIEAYQHIAFDGRVYGTRLSDRDGKPCNPDFVQLARAYGVDGVRIETLPELRELLPEALSKPGARVIEVIVGPTRLKASGRWDVGAVLSRDGQFKRERGAHTGASAPQLLP